MSLPHIIKVVSRAVNFHGQKIVRRQENQTVVETIFQTVNACHQNFGGREREQTVVPSLHVVAAENVNVVFENFPQHEEREREAERKYPREDRRQFHVFAVVSAESVNDREAARGDNEAACEV